MKRPDDPAHLLHLIDRDEWHQALAQGELAPAPEGFVHLSTIEQVGVTAGRYYAESHDLLVLAIPTAGVDESLKWEESHPGEWFPHVYAPIAVALVQAVLPFPPPFVRLPAVHSLGEGTSVRRAVPDHDAARVPALGDVADGRRPATPADPGAGVEVAPDRVERYRELLAAPGGVSLVYEEDGGLLAAVVAVPERAEFGRGDPVAGSAHVCSLATRPDAWGRGLASLVLRHLEVDLGQHGYDRAGLWAHDDNLRARRLYERLGWTLSNWPPGLDGAGDPMIHYERVVPNASSARS